MFRCRVKFREQGLELRKKAPRSVRIWGAGKSIRTARRVDNRPDIFPELDCRLEICAPKRINHAFDTFPPTLAACMLS